MDRLTCEQPDRDCPKLMCGHPLPCPWHTAVLHIDKTPPTVEIPSTAKGALQSRRKLAEVAEVLGE
jgi:hypothetical protein